MVERQASQDPDGPRSGGLHARTNKRLAQGHYAARGPFSRSSQADRSPLPQEVAGKVPIAGSGAT